MADGGTGDAAGDATGDGDAADGIRLRVRGIYATAITGLALDAGHRVVDASPPIRRRFDADVPAGPVDVDAATTDDRQGVGLAGDPDAVAAARDLLAGVARDALSWPDPAPRGAVVSGRVTETLGGGAVVDLGGSGTEGYLPYDAVEAHVTTGDRLRLQVRESAPPWSDRRPELAATLRVPGALATLVPGGGVRVAGDDEDARELAGMLDLLGLEPPDGWGIAWHRPAVGAGGDALAAALDRLGDRADALAAGLTGDGGDGNLDPAADPLGAIDPVDPDPDPDPDSDPDSDRDGDDGPGRLAAPLSGAWLWFGRESRFALDERRRKTTTTMPGHHRIKAGAPAASAGVDFAEALCDPSGAFPFDVVADQFGPAVGDRFRIEHGKPDGRLITLGEGRVADREGETVTLRREMTPGGTYDELGVPRESGDVAVTKLREGRAWYPTVYRNDAGESKGTYVNVCTPVELFPEAARYVDLHVDVVRHADGTVERVDDDELDAAVAAGHVPGPLADRAREVAAALERGL